MFIRLTYLDPGCFFLTPTYLNYCNLLFPLAQGPCIDYFFCLNLLLVVLLGMHLISLTVLREAIPDPSSYNHTCELVLSLIECLLPMKESLIFIPRPSVDHINYLLLHTSKWKLQGHPRSVFKATLSSVRSCLKSKQQNNILLFSKVSEPALLFLEVHYLSLCYKYNYLVVYLSFELLEHKLREGWDSGLLTDVYLGGYSTNIVWLALSVDALWILRKNIMGGVRVWAKMIGIPTESA